jgi:hypothetical protein
MSDDSTPFKPTVLSADELAILDETQLQNLLKKVAAGGLLTDKENAFIRSRSQPGKAAAAASEPAGAPLTRETIAARYAPVTLRTIDRCEECASLPGVPPPPWADPHALAAWYREHYRSDVTRPPTRREKLPAWLQSAVTTPRPSAPVSGPSEPFAGHANAPAPLLSPAETLNAFRQVVADKYQRWQANRHDPATEAAYMDAAEKLQAMELRARRSGDTDDLPRSRIIATLEKFLSRVPRRLPAELTACYQEARRVFLSSEPEIAWRDFVRDFFSTHLRRLAETRFADLLDAHQS